MSKYFNDNQNKTKKNRSLIYLLLFIFAILAAPAIPFLYYFTDLFLPMEKSYKVAVESGNGEIYETNLVGSGAVNKKGEFLFRYNAGRLDNYIGLYLDTGSWNVSNTVNPYFKGKIACREGFSYHASETVYDSASKSHQVDTFYKCESISYAKIQHKCGNNF